MQATQVDTFSNDLDISNCFANNYKSLFSNVLSSKFSLSEIDRSINSAVTVLIFDRKSGYFEFCTFIDIKESIRSLKWSKSDGVDETICSDNYKYYTDRMLYLIKCIINIMFIHGHAPTSFLRATVIPIPKNL